MNKPEYLTTKYWCYIRCTPEENKCKECQYLKIYKELEII